MADDVVETLVLQLLDWLSTGDQPYERVMSAWRTSCPRFPVWEEAIDRGLVTVQRVDGRAVVRITEAGRALLNGNQFSPKHRGDT
jgi:D-3-phosphoglycerate dehydrogenase